MLSRLRSGWLRSAISSQEISVVMPKICSTTGRKPLTRTAVPIPAPIAAALSDANCIQLVNCSDSQFTGPMIPVSNPKIQTVSPE